MAPLGSLGTAVRESVTPNPSQSYVLWSVPSFATGRPERLFGRDIGSTKMRVRDGDVLICKINPRINRVWEVDSRHGADDHIASPEWVAFRPDRSVVTSAWLRHVLSSPAVRRWLEADVSGVTGSHTRVKPARVLATQVPVPPLDEQQRIVAVLEDQLSRLDAAANYIAAAQGRGDRLEEAALSTADGTRTAEVPVRELLGEPLANGRSVPGGRGAAVLRLTALRSAEVDAYASKRGSWTEEDAAPFLIQQGDLLLSRGNGSLRLVGRAAMVVEPPPPVAFPDTMIRLRPDPRLIAPALLLRLWNSRHVRRQIESAVRTTAGIYKVNQKQLLDIKLRVPPRELQSELLDRLQTVSSDANRLGGALASAAERSRALRRALLDAAFSGRL